jgi:23S rRNA pseudouridine955/2504/2580 synthase
VRVDGRRAKPDQRLAAGEKVRLPPVRMTAPEAPRRPPDAMLARLAARVVYEDDHLLALDKPAGLAVHGGSGVAFGAIEALRVLRPEARTLELVHRLDRDTSGLLLIAKRRSALRALHAAWREGAVRKFYLALLVGRWDGEQRRVDVALEVQRPEGGERVTKVARSGGQTAVSVFRTLRRFASATLVEVEIETGRMHQIRVHAAHLGHPVAGDDKYGDREANRSLRAAGVKRMCLHAHRLGLPHPVDGRLLELEAPLDREIAVPLEKMA